jgi:hypothetical protein
VINRYLRAAETMAVVRSGRTPEGQHYFWLHPVAQKFKIPDPPGVSGRIKSDDLARAWQHMMSGLVLCLRTSGIFLGLFA